jgi:hypothetical protein
MGGLNNSDNISWVRISKLPLISDMPVMGDAELSALSERTLRNWNKLVCSKFQPHVDAWDEIIDDIGHWRIGHQIQIFYAIEKDDNNQYLVYGKKIIQPWKWLISSHVETARVKAAQLRNCMEWAMTRCEPYVASEFS